MTGFQNSGGHNWEVICETLGTQEMCVNFHALHLAVQLLGRADIQYTFTVSLR